MSRFACWLVLAAVTCTTEMARAQTSGPAIDWEVANRFPLFRDEAQFRGIVDVQRQQPPPSPGVAPALALELELERRAADKSLGKAFGNADAVARFGWASAVADRTCFRVEQHGHRPCMTSAGDEFLDPVHFDLIARLTAAPGGGARACRWTVEGVTPVSAKCDQTVELHGLSYGKAFSITVDDEGGVELARLEGQSARFVTVVGFGDSFAAGEGNPDHPAVLGDEASDYQGSSRLGRGYRYYPLRKGSSPTSLGSLSAAHWLSSQCHRSLYSQQLKASLQIAIEEPHLAVIFIGYACTGAEVTEGILQPWSARSDVSKTSYDESPQVVKFLRDACSDPAPYLRSSGYPADFDWRAVPSCENRRVKAVDALLVSIGGNDVGFANVIANEAVDSTHDRFRLFRQILYRLWLKEARPERVDEARDKALSLLPNRFADLAEALRRYVKVGPEKIIQTAYPQLTDTGLGPPCDALTDGMDVHEILGLRPTTGSVAKTFVRTFNDIIKTTVAGLGGSSWTVVDGHVGAFAGHALCQAGVPSGAPMAAMAGSMHFPSWKGGQRWTPYNPSNWRPYLPKNRWFVTPNDAFLTGDYMSSTFPVRDKAQPLWAATLSGSFHPNALGHAAIADAVVPALRRVLGL